MSLVTNLTSAFTRVATEVKSLRTLINGNAADNSALTTTAKSNLVAAINEVKASVGAAGSSTLSGLTDVNAAARATGHLLRYDTATSKWVSTLGTTYFDAAGAAAAAQSASQPLDSDLTAIAALSTTAYGRAFLALADQAGLMGLLSAASATASGVVQLATDAETTAGAVTTKATTPANVKAAIAAVVNAAPATLDTLAEIDAAINNDPNFATTMTTALAGKQPLDSDLTAIAALVSAADRLPYSTGAGTWALATFTTVARALLDDPDVATMRGTLSVFSQAEIGDVAHDFVADFTTGLV